MTSICDAVAERVALGESLGELADHGATCERCRRVIALPAQLGAVHRDVDPGLGFTARMTAGAQHRLVVRRRRRIAAGLATSVAAGVVGVVVMMRAPEAPVSRVATETQLAPTPTPTASDPELRQDLAEELSEDPWAPARPLDDAELQLLVDLADVDRSLRVSARWRRIEKPVSPYRLLINGVSP